MSDGFRYPARAGGNGSPNLEKRTMDALLDREPRSADPPMAGESGGALARLTIPSRIDTAWCGVGGERGGEIVPRWFGNLADIGVAHVNLFWAMPDEGQDDAGLERLRSVSSRWLAEIRAMGMEGNLSIKRGDAGPWLTSLAEISANSIIVSGPPATRGARSATVQHLLRHASSPVLLLPDLIQPPIVSLWARVVTDADPEPARSRVHWPAEAVEWIDLDPLDPVRAVRTALRLAEDVDATMICFPRRAAALAPLALEYGNFAILVPPAGEPEPPFR